MAKLSIKIKSKDFSVTIKGDAKDVKETFNEVSSTHFADDKEDAIRPLLKPNDTVSQGPRLLNGTLSDNETFDDSTIAESEDSLDAQGNSEEPSLFDVVIKNLPGNEPEWITTFAYYMKKDGKSSFTREDIITTYNLAKRKTKSRINNLTNNINSACRQSYLRYLNDSDIVITEEGVATVKNILKRQPSTSRTTSKPSREKANDRSTTTPIQNDNRRSNGKARQTRDLSIYKDLNFRPKDRQSLKDFASQYIVKTGPKRVVLITYYLANTLGISPIDQKHIRTGMHELTGKVPASVYQIINNVKTRNKWLDYNNINDIKLSSQGQNFVDYELDRVSNE